MKVKKLLITILVAGLFGSTNAAGWVSVGGSDILTLSTFWNRDILQNGTQYIIVKTKESATYYCFEFTNDPKSKLLYGNLLSAYANDRVIHLWDTDTKVTGVGGTYNLVKEIQTGN